MIEIPRPNIAFEGPAEGDAGNRSDNEVEDEQVGQDDLFAVVDLEDDIDVSSDLWETPGVKQLVDRINKIARINRTKFAKSLGKPLTSNLQQSEEALSNAQEVYRFEPGSSAFPEVAMDALRKEYANFIQQPILFQESVDKDMEVCLFSSHTQYKTSSFTLSNIQDGGHCHKCKDYLHAPGLAEHSFKSRLNLIRHM